MRWTDVDEFPGDARCYFEVSQDHSTYALSAPAELRHVATTLIGVCGKPIGHGRFKRGGLGGIVNRLGE